MAPPSRTWREGLVVGLTAYAAVAVFYALFDLFAARLIAQVERQPSHARLVLFTIVAGFAVTILAVGLLTGSMRPVLPWWSIVVANLLAVFLAGRFLLRKHPGIWQRLLPSAG